MPMTMEQTIRYAAIADRMVVTGKDLVERFKDRLAQNPANAFEWSGDAFKGAAFIQVGSELASVNTDVEIDEIIAYALQRVMGAARYPARSSSMQSNLMEQEIGAAWAHAHERLVATFKPAK